MSRKKVKLQYIINHSNRRTTYNKRKNGIIKKVKEISTLCGIEACVIIYGEYSNEPEVWPAGPGTLNVLRRYRSCPELERSKRAVDLEGFLTQSIEKSQEKLRKQISENKKKRFTNIIDKAMMYQQFDTSLVQLNEMNDLMAFLDSNIKEVNQKLNSMDAGVGENAGNGIQAMTGVEQQGNIGNAQGMVNGGNIQAGNAAGVVHGGNMQAGVHGLDPNMGYGVQTDYANFPWDLSMLPYDYNMDIDHL